MSFKVNFNAHGKDLEAAYQAVLNNNDPTNWLIYSYDKGTSDLRVQATGEDGLEELTEEFADGKIQFAYTRVIDPNTELPKFVFIAWCGSGVPETRKAFFNNHMNDVSKFFKSFHVQINARDEADVEPELIMKRVSESSGAKYSVHKEQSKPQPAVTPVGSVYQKTQIPDIASMQKEAMTRDNMPAPVGTNYTPVQTAPKRLTTRWGSQAQDSGAAAVRAEREKAEREVREREEQAARVQQQRDMASDQQRQQQMEAENQRRQQEEAARREQEDAARRDQEEAERRRQQEQEEQERQQRANEEEQRRAEEAARQEEHRRRQQQEEEDARRRQQEEDEARRLQQQQEEDQRREEEERLQREAERQQQEQQSLQSQLDDTADRAVHKAANVAADASMAQHGQGLCAVVLFGYEAGESNEMSLMEGEVVTQIDQVDEGWWFGVSEDNTKQGLFPANYVQLLEEAEQPPQQQQQQHQEPEAAPPAPPAPAPPAAPAAPPAPTPPAAAPSTPAKEDFGQTAVGLYDYEAGEDNEISFRENEVITHIEFVSEDWWQGVAPDGKSVGLFPANYVQLQQ
ncbi:uncharacterized protein BYT42DRAFT_613043 [Radiomyces spectabilis]|uniref:uncharacterized protein n=1 Tax=Radiomyces spectabilis TaxID=64574 RepID=UPI00221E9357|nr:uncharacterized protein BYT42DRAFT_613043 [Radiomyces spectabilis]KAI8381244.1 hypothetical protein BYT42DRAFT_613043 [Radiomyces spectabilis]